jgi:uncharacterized membrane protein
MRPARQALVAAVLAGLDVAAMGSAHAEDNVKCFGIAKASQHDRAGKTGVPGCAGKAKVDNDKGDFKNVP